MLDRGLPLPQGRCRYATGLAIRSALTGLYPCAALGQCQAIKPKSLNACDNLVYARTKHGKGSRYSFQPACLPGADSVVHLLHSY